MPFSAKDYQANDNMKHFCRINYNWNHQSVIFKIKIIPAVFFRVKLTASTQLDITHQDIAEDLHTSRVVISRLLKQLEKEGKIELGRNKIDVLEF